ncbi:disulfide bond formation protein B [Paracoccus tegillarcae]|uniref:Disulfide bond formation protein B n=1 Tax=Paracoccus tegillarcae TaxID=1529068 RepID=A0A2K9EJ35_9RHOB|nr:disulfide bond formation protein B [Paracoccus tegillarcae]AUH35003.1 disulfide bond formation protein B [Paracoccus tegillarcae]
MRNLTDGQIATLAGLGSAALLAAALFFQSIGYAPCELCILQRWPHLIAALIGLAIWFTGFRRWLAVLGMAAAATAMGLALYHLGVEYGWWPGPAHCSGGVSGLTSMSTEDLMAQLQAAPVVRCDEVSWRLVGLSMAGWNMLCSAVLVVIWGLSLRRTGEAAA